MVSSNRLTGTVSIPKEALEHEFLNREPANRRSAYSDLWFLANDRARTVKFAGRDVSLQRGQLAHSQTTLSKLWRWSPEKVKSVLVEFQNEGLITFEATNTTTIITVLDYTVFNPDTATKAATETGAEPITDTATETAQKGEGGRLEGGSGKEPHFPQVEVPSRNEFLAACLMRGIPEWRSAKEFNWREEDPERRWPRANWQRAVTTLFERWREEGAPAQPLNFRVVEKNGGGRSPAQARFEVDRELREIRARLDSAYELSMEPDPEDVNRERVLEKQLEAIGK